MIDIDYIMDLMDWNRSENDQAKGLELAKNVQNFNVFLQPCNEKYNKNVWDNCAKILSQKTDKELMPYLENLLEWLQDLNWPGALIILDRLNHYSYSVAFNPPYNECMKRAVLLEDEIWEENLKLIKRETTQ